MLILREDDLGRNLPTWADVALSVFTNNDGVKAVCLIPAEATEMNWQVALMYGAVSVVCAIVAIRLQPRHFPGELLAYVIVGAVGAWVGNLLGLPFGALVCGVSIWASVLGAGMLIELDYRLNTNICNPRTDVAVPQVEPNRKNVAMAEHSVFNLE